MVFWRGANYSTIIIIILTTVSAGNSGCGYHFITRERGVLREIKTIAIPYFVNRTYEPGIERIFTEALVNEFVESGEFSITTEERAEVVMRGIIKSLEEKAISFNRNDRSMEYRLTVSLDFSVEERTTGRVLWHDKNLVHNEEYRVAIEDVPSDIFRTRGHYRAKQDISISEFNKENALKSLAEELAERIHDNLIEGF